MLADPKHFICVICYYYKMQESESTIVKAQSVSGFSYKDPTLVELGDQTCSMQDHRSKQNKILRDHLQHGFKARKTEGP